MASRRPASDSTPIKDSKLSPMVRTATKGVMGLSLAVVMFNAPLSRKPDWKAHLSRSWA